MKFKCFQTEMMTFWLSVQSMQTSQSTNHTAACRRFEKLQGQQDSHTPQLHTTTTQRPKNNLGSGRSDRTAGRFAYINNNNNKNKKLCVTCACLK